MDMRAAPIWSLLEEGQTPTISKKACLETAIALIYAKMLYTQRPGSSYLYQPFFQKVCHIEQMRRTEMRSWFGSDADLLGNLDLLYDDPYAARIERIAQALHEESGAAWALHLLSWIQIGARCDLTSLPDAAIPFYGHLPDGQLVETGFAVPLKDKVNAYPKTRCPVVPQGPFWNILVYIRNAALPVMQSYAVTQIILSTVFVQTDPIKRALGDTLISALYQDVVAGCVTNADLWDKIRNKTEAFPVRYSDSILRDTGLDWLCDTCDDADDREGVVNIDTVRRYVEKKCRFQTEEMFEDNPNLSNMSIESFQSSALLMADAAGTDPDADDAAQDAASTTATTPAGSSSQDDTTPTDDTDTPAQSDATQTDTTPASTPKQDTQTDQTSDTATTDTPPTPPAPVAPPPAEDNIAGLSFDTTGETRADYLYRRGVLALASRIRDDIDFPVTDEVRSLLKSFVETMLFAVPIESVRDYMKKLGLQGYLEAVSF